MMWEILRLFLHGGSDKSVNMVALGFLKTKQSLIIFTNVENGYTVYEAIINQYFGETGRKIVDIETK